MLNELTSNKWLVFPSFQLVFSSLLCTPQYSALIDHVFLETHSGHTKIFEKNNPHAIEVLRGDGDICPSIPFSH
jgi:hypothetical protein